MGKAYSGDLRCREVGGVRQCLEEAGMVCYLRASSPRLQPDRSFEVIAAAGRAVPRSFDAIVDAFEHLLDRLRPAECTNYFPPLSYGPT